MNETFVIDGMNLCWWYRNVTAGGASIRPLLTILISVLKNGDDFYCVFDASVTHTLRAQGEQAEANIIESLLRDYPQRFFRVTGSTRADGAILHDADHNMRRIISNDKYRDYEEQYEWLANKHCDRLVQGNLQPSGLITLEKLSYGRLVVDVDVETAFKELVEMIQMRSTSFFSILNKAMLRHQRELKELKDDFAALQAEFRMFKSDLSNQRRVAVAVAVNPDSAHGSTQANLSTEQQCVQQAQLALSTFLEPYGNARHQIQFEGSSWATAVKKLQIFFDQHKVCTHCYQTATNYQFAAMGKENCLRCEKGKMTNNSTKIWEVVNHYCPPR